MAEKEKKKVPAIVIEGFEINAQNVTYHKLQEFALTLYEKLLKQRGERNFLTLERDRLRAILENTRHEILVAEETVRNTERQVEEARERYRREKREVEQEVKWLLYEHGTNMAELTVWEGKELERTAEKDLEEELELLREKRKIKEKLLKQDRLLKEKMESLKADHEKDFEQMVKTEEDKQIENEMRCRRNFVETVDHINLKHDMEMSEIEERKNTHFVELKRIHRVRLEEMKSHFNSITAENLAVISNQRQSIENMKKNKYVVSSEVKVLSRENSKLKDSLDKLIAETNNLNRQVINYEKDLLSLKNNKRMLKKTVSQTKENKKQSVKALRRIRNGSLDVRNGVDSSCSSSFMGFNIIASDKRKRLEGSVEALIEELSRKQKIIGELSTDPDVGSALQDLRFEFWSPQTLTYELKLVCKAYDELLKTFQETLLQFCIPENELEGKTVQLKDTGHTPAGLVSKQY